MGTALLLGIPVGDVGKARSAFSQCTVIGCSWSLKFIPAPRKDAEISQKMVNQANDIAARYDDTHVLGFSAQSSREDFADQIRPYFRFRWFDHSLLKHLSRPDPSHFVKCLASNLAEESEWAARVKPRDLHSPL